MRLFGQINLQSSISGVSISGVTFRSLSVDERHSGVQRSGNLWLPHRGLELQLGGASDYMLPRYHRIPINKPTISSFISIIIIRHGVN